MAVHYDEIQYVWKGNNREAINAIAELESKNLDLAQSVKDLKRQQGELRADGKKHTQQYKDNNLAIASQTKDLKANTLALQQQRKEVGLLGISTSQLMRDKRALQAQEKHQLHDSDAQNKLLEKRLLIEAELQRRGVKKAPVSGFLNQMKANMPAALAGGIAGGVVGLSLAGLSALGDGLRAALPPMKELADANSDLKIALNLTDEELTNINNNIRGMKTRTATSDLKGIGVVAGDLNVATAEVAGFIKETDKGALVFKRSFASAEEYATAVGKLKGLYKEFKDAKYGDAINDIGSGMKVLEDDGPATAKSILEFTTRMGQLPEKLRPAIADTMAYAAVLEEAGLTAEISTGGLSNVLLVASKNTAAFGRQMRMSNTEVKDLLNSNPNEFLKRLAWSFQNASPTTFGNSMKALKLDSQESVKVIGVLSENLDKLQDKQSLANRAVADGSRLTEIFNEKNGNFAGKVEMANKRIEEGITAVWSPFRRVIQGTIVGFGDLIGAYSNTDTSAQGLSETYNKLSSKIKFNEDKVVPLITRYQELKTKTNLTTAEQAELKKIIAQVANQMPAAITKVNEYGVALEINTTKAHNFMATLGKSADAMKKGTEAAMRSELIAMRTDLDKKQTFIKDLLDESKYKLTDKGYESKKAPINYSNNGQYGSTEHFVKSEVINFNKFKEHTNALMAGQQAYDEAMLAYRKLKGNVATPIVAVDKPEFTGLKSFGGAGDGNDDYQKRIQKIQDETQAIFDAQVKRRNASDLKYASDKNKQVLEIEQAAEEKLIALKRQFKDENGLVLDQEKWSKNQHYLYKLEKYNVEKEADTKIKEIRKDQEKQQNSDFFAELDRAKQLTQQKLLQIAQLKVEKATASGDEKRIYDAKSALLVAENNSEQAKLKDHYAAKRRELKGNNDALALLDKSYFEEATILRNKYVSQQELMDLDAFHKNRERRAVAKVEAQKLDAEEAKGKGIFAQRNSQLSMLEVEKSLELSNKNLIEDEKTNIQKKYAQKRFDIEATFQNQLANNIINYFGQALQSISALEQTRVQNDIQTEDTSHKKRLDNLDKQKDKGIITAEQASEKKTKLEESHDKKMRALQRKQAELNQQNQIASALMAMFKSIVEVIGTPWMIPIVSGLGLLNIANIANTKLPAYKDGGFTDNPQNFFSSFSKPSPTAQLAWVNEDGLEYVVSNDLLQRPAVANMVQIMENMKTANGYANGGYTQKNTTLPQFSPAASTAQPPVVINLPAEFQDAVFAIAQLYKQGIPVHFAGADYRRFHADYQDFQNSNNQTNIS